VKKRPRLTRARLRDLLHYNKTTGEFHWRNPDGNAARLGRSAGSLNSHREYRYIKINGRMYREHQLAWFYIKGRWGRPIIDHRDGDGTNNRWSNLRRATMSQNAANRRRPRQNTSGYKGVYLCRKTGKWRACIGKDGETIQLGRFETPQAAHKAYVAAARKLFGEFARAE
jgi:HNH endonuclease/AP2 domain-containing protein